MTIQRFVKRWFKSRKLDLRPYQPEKLEEVDKSLREGNLTVLAAAPNSGKTYMSICYCDWYLEHINREAKILVLTHGTSTLRSQYAADILVVKPNYSYQMLEKGGKFDDSQVVITLPQTIRAKKLPVFTLLISDEAHHFYEAKMVQDIIKRTKIISQLLLTGTPSSFVGRSEYKIIPITLDFLIQAGYAQDVNVSVYSSPYDFLDTDYTPKGDLTFAAEKKLTESATYSTLESVFERMPDVKTEKTLYVCRSIAQARDVKSFLNRNKINYLLSTSENDLASTGMIEFKINPNIQALIVVNRGVLGYSYTELLNVVDLTCSRNIDKQFQLLCRLVRKGKTPLRKRFLKVVPERYNEYFQYIMMCTISMSHEYWYLNYNGTNEMSLDIPRLGTGRDGGYSRSGEIKDIRIDLFSFGISMAKVFNTSMGVATTTLGKVRSEFLGIATMWSHKLVLEEAKKYGTIQEWSTGMPGSYGYALKTKKIDGGSFFAKCTAHMTVRPSWSDEIILKEAKKYTNVKEWYKSSGSLNAARKRGKEFYAKCTAHMAPLNRKWNDEDLLESARKYKTKSEWAEYDGSAYVIAIKNKKLFLKCTAHMEKMKIKPSVWTEPAILEEVKKYKTRKEWAKNSASSYSAARKLGAAFINLCTAHMARKIIEYNEQLLLESAKKYKTITEWKTKDRPAHWAAQKIGKAFIEKCKAHMMGRK